MKTTQLIPQLLEEKITPLFRGRLALLLAGGLAMGLSLLVPQPAVAAPGPHGVRVHGGHRHAYRPHRPYRAYRPYGRVVMAPGYRYAPYGPVRAGYFVVPRRIAVRADVVRYRAYYDRRVYFRGHGHYHRVYQFPIYSKSRRSMRSYSYCGGTLYGGVRLVYR
jgi:hypothetical protein